MSGLASFFKAFLPGKEDAEEQEQYEYHESIANVIPNDAAPEPESPPPDPRTQSAAEWRAMRNDGLRVYMERRMLVSESQEDDDEKENHEDYIVPDNDEVNVPFWNEDANESQPTEDATVSTLCSQTRRKKIPHVEETLHIAKTLSALDLYAREFHLSLGLVEKVWPLRAIPRREWKISSKFEDDGPLGTLFKQVLSMEVTQLQDNPDVAAMAQAAFQARSPQRLKIFFYNKYALQLSTLLKQEHASRILISLENIPAKCILPLDVDDFSWYDREGLAPCCVCIGDRSSMKLEYDGVLQKLPFDEPDSKVTIARVSNNGEVVEVDLTHASVKTDLLRNERESLETAYQAWEQEQKEKENTALENDEEMPQQEDEADEASGNNTRCAQSANDERGKKKARTEEKYHTLSELCGLYEARKEGASATSPNLTVSLFAAVLGFSSPTFTKGMDWMVKIALVDESTPLPMMGDNADETVASTAIVIFCRQRDELPKILKAGDVLRLHRVGIQEWKGDIQLVGKRCSSFVVVRPQNTDSTDPEDAWNVIPTAKGGAHFGKSDTERAAALWQWAKGRFANYPTLHHPSSKLTLADLARPEQTNVADEKTGDITLMVSAILPVPQALRTTATPPGFLRVWDGTGAPMSDPLPLASAGAAEAIKKGDPPLEALQAIANAIDSIKSADDGDDASSLNAPECLCGRVANVAVWEEPNWDLVAETLQVGTFIRLRNVHEGRMYNGLRCLMISSRSGLTPLPNDTFEIKELLKDHQKRVLRKDPFNPQSGILPLEDDDGEIVSEAGPAPDEKVMGVNDAPVASRQDGLASIAQCISEPAPGSFKVKFHITGTMSWSQDEGSRLRRLCVAGPGGRDVQFRFAVNINDETAAIDALVSNEVGEDLFQLEAADAMEIPSSDADAIFKEVTNEAKFWKGEIRSSEVNGSRFFVLHSVAPVHNV